jgi:hypothetical protein
MAEVLLPFGDLQPDYAPLGSPGLVTARNLTPRKGSYGPFHDLSTISGAISARALGSVSGRDKNNDTWVYCGDESKLYELTHDTWADQSKSGGYATGANDNWEFALWNNSSKIIATNYANPVQSLDIGGGASGAFADMITSPASNAPKAKHIGIVHRFVVLGWISDADGETSNRIRWSAIADEADFSPSATTQSDYEDLPTGGVVRKIVGGAEYGLIFQNAMVRAMRYVGAGPVFEISPVNYAPGTPIPNSVISHKGLVFYLSEDGFQGISGVNVQPLGDGRVDRYFWGQFDVTNRRYVSSAIDPINKVVAWAFPGSGNTGGLPNRILMCKWDEMRWTEVEIDTEHLMRSETQGYTLETLDNVGTDIDNSTVFDESFDSDKWKGGQFRFAAFNQAHQLCHFTGANLAATIETSDLQLMPGARSQINGVAPIVDGGFASVSVSARQRLRDTVSYRAASAMNATGVCPVRGAGMYHRIRVSLSSSTSWSHVEGLRLDFTGPLGRR